MDELVMCVANRDVQAILKLIERVEESALFALY